MINSKWKLLGALGIASALALSAAPVEARTVHHHRHAVEGAFAYAPSHTRHFIDDGVGYNGTGTFSDGRRVPGTNWNPNES
jgi:hypothetical protein